LLLLLLKVNTLDPGTVNTKMLLAGWGCIGFDALLLLLLLPTLLVAAVNTLDPGTQEHQDAAGCLGPHRH
jgi:hypothetical protein